MVCNTCPWMIADLTSLGEGDGHVRVCEFLAAALILKIEKAMLVNLDRLPRSSHYLNFS